jgi:integrase
MRKAAVKVETNFPHLLRDKDRHGTPRTYYRRAGRPMVRLHSQPGTLEFVAEYQRAVEGNVAAPVKALPKTEANDDSLRSLIVGYYKSANFLTLAESTKRSRRGILDHICESVQQTKAGPKTRGTLPFSDMKATHVRAIRDEKVDLPGAANGRLKALSQVFSWAIEADLIETNPARAVRKLSSGSEGFHTWTVEEVRRYEAKHPIGTKARLALALLLFTGVRRSDVVKLGHHMERDGVLHFAETKGAKSKALNRSKNNLSPKTRTLPILPELREVIDATPSGQFAYLTTVFNKPFTAPGFGNKFREWCDAAGLADCSAHGCRKAGAKIAAENGATVHQLMAIFGWNTLRQAEVYTRDANKVLLAGEAMHLLVPREKNKASV